MYEYDTHILENQQEFDIVSEPQYNFFFNNGQNERCEKDSLRVLSLFSGCGGMDLGLEGGFICHKKSVKNNSWINNLYNDNWVILKKTDLKLYSHATY